eukprot:scaffold577253_cov32-Prasinocladus_malaysianus.AAC.1
MMTNQDPGVSCMTLSPDSKLVVIGSNTALKVWDLQSSGLVVEEPGHSDGVTCVACASDRKRIVSGSKDKTLRVWDVDSLQPACLRCTATLKGHDREVHCVALSADGRVAISASSVGTDLK